MFWALKLIKALCVFTDAGVSRSGADNIEEWGGSLRKGVFVLIRWRCHSSGTAIKRRWPGSYVPNLWPGRKNFMHVHVEGKEASQRDR